LTVFSVFDMLMVILLCFSLKVADVSLSESGHLVPWWLTSHSKRNEILDQRAAVKYRTLTRRKIHNLQLAG